jgi:hypothetical protein
MTAKNGVLLGIGNPLLDISADGKHFIYKNTQRERGSPSATIDPSHPLLASIFHLSNHYIAPRITVIVMLQ